MGLYGYRLRLILCRKESTILGMDQNCGVTDNGTMSESRRRMRKCSAGCANTIWRVEAGDSGRYETDGNAQRAGAGDVGLMLRMLAGHDLSHLETVPPVH